MAIVSYEDSIKCGERFEDQLKKLIINQNLIDICDIGGGANPILDIKFHDQHNLNYTLLDISQAELDKAPSHYNKLCADILQKDQLPSASWDLVFSQTLAEHVKDGQLLHENVFNLLKQGGYAIHIFPTLFAFPFIVNRILPERLGSKILDIFLPRDRFQNDKFPAYYSWCMGPNKKMLNRFQEIGYEVVSYQGLFGHRYYRFLKPLQKLQDRYADWLVKHPIPYQTSYAILLLRKPTC